VGLVLDNPVALTSRHADSPGELLAGTAAEAEGPLLLPPRLLAELARRPRGVPVRLGSYEALAYRGLRHRRASGALTVIVVPTERGAATIACLANERGARALTRCEQVATTLALHGVKALPLGADRRFTAKVRRIIDRLNAGRIRGRRALAAARRPAGQAAAADRLAAAYRVAYRALRKLKPGPVERPAHRALLGALLRADTAYRALALGARTGNERVFRLASVRVRRAEAAVERPAREST
jgi:hypothetical protein